MEGLNRELLVYYENGKPFPMIRHPLVYAVPFFSSQLEVKWANEQLAAKKAAVAKAFNHREYGQYIALHERPYRIAAFQDLMDDLDDAAYWELLRDVWVDSENIYQNCHEWEGLLRSERSSLSFMEVDDRAELEKLPLELVVYRGTKGIERDGHYLGFSWTLDEEKARWFARRFTDDDAVIARAVVSKSHIFGYIAQRGEKEIVLDPNDLRELEWKKV